MTLDIGILYWYIGICLGFFFILFIAFFIGYQFAKKIDRFALKKQELEYEKKQNNLNQTIGATNKIKTAFEKFDWFNYKGKRNRYFHPDWMFPLLSEIRDDLHTIAESIKNSQESTLLPQRKQMFLHSAWAIFSMLLKVQAVICFFWLCIFALGKIYEAAAPEIDLWVCGPNSEEYTKLTANLSYASLGILAVFTIAVASLALIFLRKGLKYLIMQYDIVFFGYKILTYILFAEKPNSDYISEEFGELSDHLRQKNSDSFWERFFFHSSDL